VFSRYIPSSSRDLIKEKEIIQEYNLQALISWTPTGQDKLVLKFSDWLNDKNIIIITPDIPGIITAIEDSIKLLMGKNK